MRGVIQISHTVSGLCVDMSVVVGGGLIFVCRCGSVCNLFCSFLSLLSRIVVFTMCKS